MSISASTSGAASGSANGDTADDAQKQRGEAELKALLARDTGECIDYTGNNANDLA